MCQMNPGVPVCEVYNSVIIFVLRLRKRGIIFSFCTLNLFVIGQVRLGLIHNDGIVIPLL